MIIHGTSPDDMRTGTMIPIPKGKRLNLSTTLNFRGICLQSILCKLLDFYMLYREQNNLSTSNMQFGFKEQLSSSTATAIVTETIDYYQDRGGAVYALALDATKAFDRVEYCQLFKMLLTRGCNPIYIRLLFNMYINQTIRVKFNKECSDYFNVTNGVKQGGVISPTLFTCYIDDMLKRLEKSNVGCHVGSQYVGCVSYADDLILLAPNVSALKHMIHICENFASEYSIKFNGSKCNLLVCDRKYKDYNFTITVSGERVEQVNNMKYLGHILLQDRNDPHTDYIRKDFIMKINSFLGDFDNVSSNLKYNLFRTYCMSLYGINIADHTNLTNICIEWWKAVRRLLHISPKSHSRLLYHIVGDIPPDVCLHQRFIHFFYAGLNSHNSLVRFMFKNSICNNTRLGKNLNFILDKIGLVSCNAYLYCPDVICHAILCDWAQRCGEADVKDGAQIRELIHMRDSHESQFLSAREIRTVIDFISTQ